MASKTGKQRKRNHLKQRQSKQQKKKKVKKRKYNPFKHLSRNQAEVAKRLIDGEISMLSHGGWGFVERFLVFLNELGMYELLGVDGKQFYRKMFNLGLLLITYEIKVLLGISSMNQVSTRLFKDLALMRLIGYTADQLLSGFCRRGKADSPKPMHKNSLADAVEKLTEAELETIFNEAIKRLVARSVFANSKGIFALDSSDLETTARYEGAGKRKKKEKKYQQGKLVEVEQLIYGFKVFALYEVEKRLVVAVKVCPLNEHDSNYTLDLVKQAQANLAGSGTAVLKVLLIDRGFLDGESLWQLKQDLSIDFVMPAKSNMNISKDARQLAQEEPDGTYIFAAQRPATNDQVEVSLTGLKALISYEQYGDAEHQKRRHRKDFEPNPINAIVISSFKGKPAQAGKEKVFLTSLKIADPLLIFDHYDLRSLIENCLFRELKQGWHLGAFPKKTQAAVRSHVYLSILCFNLTNVYRSHEGQDITEQGIRRQRLDWHSPNHVVIFAGDYYGIFDLEEVLILLACPPQLCWRVDPDQVRHRYRCPQPPSLSYLPRAA